LRAPHDADVQVVAGHLTTDVEVRLQVLSNYLGHVSPTSTYWYLSASPPLLVAAARRLERTWEQLS
jgi:hypothetical protein